MKKSRHKFPENFIWGTATSSYQIGEHLTVMERDLRFGIPTVTQKEKLKIMIPVI